MKKRLTLKDFAHSNPRVSLKKWEVAHFIEMSSVDIWCVRSPSDIQEKIFTGSGSKFENGDTIFARITPCLQNGKISKVSWIEKGFGSTEFFVFRAIEWVSDPDYLYYLLIQPRVRAIAEGSMVWASGRQRADISHIENIEIEVPESLEEQRRIASILSAYDDLIENNTKRIKVLESMAEELYKEWFVRFRFPGYESVQMVESGTEFWMIPEGWEVRKINEVIDIKSGYPFKTTSFVENWIYGLVTIKNVQDWKFIKDCTNGLSEIPKNVPDFCYLQDGDILLSLTWNVWRVCFVYGKRLLLNQRVAKLVPKSEIAEGFTYLMFRQKDFQKRLEMLSNGVAQKNLSPVETWKIHIINPSLRIMERFHDGTSSFLKEIINLHKNIETLQTTRDTLIKELF